jgi:hypothetical protein
MILEVAADTHSGLSFLNVFGVIGAILGILGLVGAGIAVLRSSYMKATVDTLKESNAALTERNTQLDRATAECSARMDALERENANLRTYVSGTDAIKSLGEQMAQQHVQQMQKFGEILDTVQRSRRATPAKKNTAARRR